MGLENWSGLLRGGWRRHILELLVDGGTSGAFFGFPLPGCTHWYRIFVGGFKIIRGVHNNWWESQVFFPGLFSHLGIS